MKDTLVFCLAAGLLLLSPLGASAQSDRVVFPDEGKPDPVIFPQDATASAAEEEQQPEEAAPAEKRAPKKAAPAENRRPPREKASTKETRQPAEMAELSLANRSTDTIWVEINPAENVLALSTQERAGSMALLPGDFQRNGLQAGGYSILIEGLAKGSPMSIAPGRAYALELSGSLGTAPGVFARMTEDGRPMLETIMRPLPQGASAQIMTTQTTELVTERRFCRHCCRWVFTQRYVTVPATRLVAQSAPVVVNHANHAFEHRWVCEECERVFAGPGVCPECDEDLVWSLVAYRCPTHHDVVVSSPSAVCWRCGGGTTELIVAGEEQ